MHPVDERFFEGSGGILVNDAEVAREFGVEQVQAMDTQPSGRSGNRAESEEPGGIGLDRGRHAGQY